MDDELDAEGMVEIDPFDLATGPGRPDATAEPDGGGDPGGLTEPFDPFGRGGRKAP
jgi:hypothetical protein